MKVNIFQSHSGAYGNLIYCQLPIGARSTRKGKKKTTLNQQVFRNWTIGKLWKTWNFYIRNHQIFWWWWIFLCSYQTFIKLWISFFGRNLSNKNPSFVWTWFHLNMFQQFRFWDHRWLVSNTRIHKGWTQFGVGTYGITILCLSVCHKGWETLPKWNPSWWLQPIWNILVKLDHFPR